jgi:hypothetical protein
MNSINTIVKRIYQDKLHLPVHIIWLEASDVIFLYVIIYLNFAFIHSISLAET